MTAWYRSIPAALLLASLAVSPARAASEPWALAVAEARAARPLALASLGLVLADAADGRVIFALGEAGPMQPASLMKLVTSAVAWRRLGPEARFVTRVVTSGTVQDGVLAGDLYLVGAGDPTLQRAGLAALAAQLRADGLRRVTGQLALDATAFATPSYPAGWVVDDLAEAYAAPVTALVLEDNVATVSGRAVPLGSPGDAAAAAWREAIAGAGITGPGRSGVGAAPAGARELARLTSPALRELLPRLNRDSHNLSAECVYRALGDGDPRRAACLVLEELERMGVASGDVRLEDGSGLSRYDLVTPRALATVLVRLVGEPGYRASLSVAGQTGTLRRRFQAQPLQGRLLAKTGTMAGVAGVAGYLEVGDRRYVAVLLANGFTGPARAVHGLLDSILIRWDELLRGGQDLSSAAGSPAPGGVRGQPSGPSERATTRKFVF